MLLTFEDTVQRLIDYCGAGPSDAVLRDAKHAAIEALRDLVQAHPWTYLYGTARIDLVPPYTQGTVTYAGTGSQVANQVTLAGGTWPDWAALGVLRIDNINYDVAAMIDGQTLQLVASKAPPEDITDPVGFGLFRDSYTLPPDFAGIDQAFIPMTWGDIAFAHPRTWHWEVSRWGLVGNPRVFTVMADPDFGGRLCMRFAPFPQLEYPVDFLYKRHANPLVVYRSNAGNVTTAPASNSIVGNGTAFTPQMAGNAVLRISGTKNPPTPVFGDNPAIFESKITSVASPTLLTTWDQVPAEYDGAPYAISSYIDIETGAMEAAYLRCCEHHIGMSRILKDKPSARLQYAEALEVAKCADSRNLRPRVAGPPMTVRLRLKDFPVSLNSEI